MNRYQSSIMNWVRTVSVPFLLFDFDGADYTCLRSSQYGRQKPMTNSSSAPKVFGPVPCLTVNAEPEEVRPAQPPSSPRVDGLAHPRGCPTEPAPREYTTLSQNNDRPADEQRNPFVVVVPPNESEKSKKSLRLADVSD